MSRLLFELVPAMAGRLPHVTLGAWPTPLDRVTVGGQGFFAKREDLGTEGYAGNKIRPLEVVFGEAARRGVDEVWATGAWGSNHALATVVHARRAGFSGGAVLWPQPWSKTAVDNLRATVARADRVVWAGSVATMPLWALWLGERRRALVMPPGAATAHYALGHAQGALELAVQTRASGLDAPATIVVPVGSTCTTVGLLVGTALAVRLGLWTKAPRIVAVRVTPWPVTDRWRIVQLALATARELEARGGPRLLLSQTSVMQRLELVTDLLGGGYGVPTRDGWRAIARLLAADTRVERVAQGGGRDGLADAVPLRLDTTYSAKAGAWLLDALPRLDGPVVFWMTKSHAALPAPDPAREAALPAAVRRFIAGPLG